MNLTPRQKSVLDLVSAGMSNKEIGSQLRISPRTVKQYLNQISMRHGMTGVNRVKLARLYTVNGRPLPENLTPRKREIARMVMEGLSNKEIGSRVGSTEQVVKNHMRDIMDLTGAWTRLELAVRFTD